MAGTLKLVLAVLVVGSAVVRGSDFVNFMSIQMEAAERLQDLPNVPALASQLGLKSLVDLVVKAGLASALGKPGPFTVFGPTDAAFAAIPAWLKKAVEDKDVLTKVLTYHVLAGKVLSGDIKDEASAATLNGKPIRFNIYPNKAITAQCAPIDVSKVDQMASNGVIHELKSVMIPPSGNIVEAAAACPAFKTLVTAVKAAGLVEVLSGEGPFTVFAPTDKAFQKLDPKVLDGLLKNKTALTNVLEYHVASLTYCSAGLVSYNQLKMLNKMTVAIKVDGGKLKVNDATVIPLGADGSVTNGVVHAIDTVLIPPGLNLGL